ncbi:MAG: hypothetical protein ACPGN3_07665 [Opitutales bacterium]
MGLLRSYWFLAVLALVVNIGTYTALFMGSGAQLATVLPKPKAAGVPREEYIPFWDFRTEQIESLVEDLKKENDRISIREAELLKIESRITSEREELERLRNEVEVYQNELMTRIITVEQSEEKNIKTLATTYAAMPAESAVKVFDEMDDFFVAKMLSMMGTETVSGIFEQMIAQGGQGPENVKRVANLSELLRLLEKKK